MRNSALVIPFIAIFAAFHLFSANVGGQLSNFSPYLALFFCGAMFWQRSKILLPLALFCTIATPIITLLINGATLSFETTIQPLLVPLAVYAVVIYIGKISQNKNASIVLASSLGCAILFHLVTNLWCFATSAFYTKNLNGLAQALWTTPDFPGAMPTAVFFRNTCLSTLLFTALFLLAARAPFFTSKASLSATTEPNRI